MVEEVKVVEVVGKRTFKVVDEVDGGIIQVGAVEVPGQVVPQVPVAV